MTAACWVYKILSFLTGDQLHQYRIQLKDFVSIISDFQSEETGPIVVEI
jgi:hypothetical protein